MILLNVDTEQHRKQCLDEGEEDDTRCDVDENMRPNAEDRID